MQKFLRNGLLGSSFCFLFACHPWNGMPMGPFMAPVSDTTITQSISMAFAHSPVVSGQPIHVETHQGVVLLTGHVKTIRQGDTAEAIAKSVAGVRIIENHVVVRR